MLAPKVFQVPWNVSHTPPNGAVTFSPGVFFGEFQNGLRARPKHAHEERDAMEQINMMFGNFYARFAWFLVWLQKFPRAHSAGLNTP